MRRTSLGEQPAGGELGLGLTFLLPASPTGRLSLLRIWHSVMLVTACLAVLPLGVHGKDERGLEGIQCGMLSQVGDLVKPPAYGSQQRKVLLRALLTST